MILSKSDHLRTPAFAPLLLLTAGRRNAPRESQLCALKAPMTCSGCRVVLAERGSATTSSCVQF